MTGLSQEQLESLFTYYAQHGCPCRFPRFRAAVSQDLKEIGAWDWDLSDARLLIGQFDRKVQLVDVTRGDFREEGRCAACHSRVVRFGTPIFRDSFVERALIEPDAMPDIGAVATWPMPIVGTVFHAGPGNVPRSEVARIEAAYPRVSPDAWLDYMRELAPALSATSTPS